MPDDAPTTNQFWLLTSDVPTGPFTVADIHAKLSSGDVTWQTKACLIGGNKWLPLVQTPGIGPTAPPEGAAPAVAANESPVAPTPVASPPVAPSPPPPNADPRVFRFRNGMTATDVSGFLQTCRDSPYTAAAQLREGDFGPWLTAIGEPALASLAETARTQNSSDDECLRFFLCHANPAPPKTEQPINPVGLIVVVLVLGLLAWGAYELLRPLTAMEVCKKLDTVKTAAEAKKYATVRMHPLIEEMFSDKSANDPNTDAEWGQEIDGPNSSKLVGFHGSRFNQEQGRRVRVEGHFRLVESDGWKVDDFVITGVEGVSLPGPVSLVDEHRRSIIPPKTSPALNKSPPTTPASDERPWYKKYSPFIGLAIIAFLGWLENRSRKQK